MNYTVSLPLILLFASSIIYSIFMSLMTFTKNMTTIFDERYIFQVNKDLKSKYHTTLYATTAGSYVGSFVLLILFLERVFSKNVYGNITAYKEFITGSYVFGLLVLITLMILLAYFSYSERIFGVGESENLTYNYPFINTLCYFVVFAVLGGLYISAVYKLAEARKLELK